MLHGNLELKVGLVTKVMYKIWLKKNIAWDGRGGHLASWQRWQTQEKKRKKKLIEDASQFLKKLKKKEDTCHVESKGHFI